MMIVYIIPETFNFYGENGKEKTYFLFFKYKTKNI